MEKEAWKDIDGYKGRYFVSNLGNVKSVLIYSKKTRSKKETIKEQILRPHIVGVGYLAVSLFKGNKRKSFYIHRLVAKAFLSNLENKKTVNHKNCIKTDNRLENLEWVTQKENINHAWREGRCTPHAPVGEKNGISKLKNVDVIEIRKKIESNIKIADIANEYGVCNATIYDIKKGTLWKHV